ncbi:pyrroloquinoline quinone biosynthesis peptide chaperone PqqD [Aquamicrobium zhengzhouense]|uniref:Pyrroloquinoline quinone biosynthesis peptide chaperone PqqD n=1 Tax=Aquamicrobium zhengzhouense TaxID=2781738 RepID=A0ABS0SFQ2_9HYPH|nr:pyrroloquinoline quinone biosynthesis peptide chaperone PqqD [Aquamicrobium zhengzhouense]MBI1621302.1 pyrroloquinoline quinone biosynthesis peptide chaperone PqqD [Aquamicrobium zhengzhouense]
MTTAITPSARPRLLSGVRTHFDKARDRWVLLAPERALELDAIAMHILAEVDGQTSLENVISALAAKFAAPREQIEQDVRAFFLSLEDRRLMEFV